jgi:hypothetical protein
VAVEEAEGDGEVEGEDPLNAPLTKRYPIAEAQTITMTNAIAAIFVLIYLNSRWYF